MKSKLEKLKDKRCKGCNLYKLCHASYILKRNIEECPCSICLIKMMCYRSCDRFSKLRGIKIYEG